MDNVSIEITDLCKSYKRGKQANAHISIQLKSHSITAFIGHNGAGKTTLLNQIGGSIKSTSGSIQICGIDSIKECAKVRSFVSSMPQFQVPLKGITMFEAIKSIGMIKGLAKEKAEEKTNEIIQYLQLEQYKNLAGEKMSGGLQRLTSFAMTVINEAPIIILDEPTNDVDPVRRILMWKYLKKLAKKGSTILIVTHNLLEVERYADRYVLLQSGRIIKDVEVVGNYMIDTRHLLCVYDIDFSDSNPFLKEFDTKYKKEERQLVVSLKEEQITRAIDFLLPILREKKATNYDLKIQSLYESYEEMTNEN